MARHRALADLARSSDCFAPTATESAENLALMRPIDELYLPRLFFGYRRMAGWLRDLTWTANEKRVLRRMGLMGLQAVVPGPHTSRPHPKHPVYPYLLRNLAITASNEVWCANITYIPLHHGYLYLVAVMNRFSRYVLAWELTNSMETDFCLRALNRALMRGKPGISNTDQGAPFTSDAYTGRLKEAGVRISMDGRGRALDNVFIERLWRSVKYEEVYLLNYANGLESHRGLERYFRFYNPKPRHQTLGNRMPSEIHMARAV